MTKMLLRYVHEFKDRHGKTRRYFRRPSFKRLPLPGAPGSEEFMAAYQAALAGATAPKLEAGAARTMPGTVAALVARYYRSAAFVGLAESTRSTYRGIIENFREKHGHRSIAQLDRETIKQLHANKAATPAAANNFLRIVRMLLDFAVDEQMLTANPAVGVKAMRYKSDGHAPWTAEQIETFRKHHPLGTRARLAMELLYSTGQRRSDVVRMGRQFVREGFITIRQKKTSTVAPIPILPELQAAIDALPNNHLTFLVTKYGKPLTAAGFGGWFRQVRKEAGLPKQLSAHGLRKSAATRLAEAGCSVAQIAAWGGWRSLKEVQRYTESADRKRLAQSAATKLLTRTSSGKP